jgi:class 3 adenylate cyclase
MRQQRVAQLDHVRLAPPDRLGQPGGEAGDHLSVPGLERVHGAAVPRDGGDDTAPGARSSAAMRGLFVHVVTYAAVNGFLVAIYLLTGGTAAHVRAPDAGFWPIWVIASWGVVLVIHAAVTMSWIRRRPSAKAAPVTVADRRPRRQWVAVLFTDVVGSTPLAHAMGDDAWHRALADHRRLVRAAVGDRRGTEVGTQGDGFLARFDSPSDAVRCAVDIQRVVGEAHAAGGPPIAVRIGVHAGEVVDDGTDVVGRVVNLAARVTAEAEAGEILVTEPVADELGDHLIVEDRGLRPLNGLDRPRHLLAVRGEQAAV